MRGKRILIAAAALAAVACLLFLGRPSRFREAGFRADAALQASLDGVRDDYRRIIVLMDGADTLDDNTRAQATAAGRLLFWRKQHALQEIGGKLGDGKNPDGIRQLIHYLTADSSLHDADKLAFSDLVEELQAPAPAPGARRDPTADSLKALGGFIRPNRKLVPT